MTPRRLLPWWWFPLPVYRRSVACSPFARHTTLCTLRVYSACCYARLDGASPMVLFRYAPHTLIFVLQHVLQAPRYGILLLYCFILSCCTGVMHLFSSRHTALCLFTAWVSMACVSGWDGDGMLRSLRCCAVPWRHHHLSGLWHWPAVLILYISIARVAWRPYQPLFCLLCSRLCCACLATTYFSRAGLWAGWAPQQQHARRLPLRFA